MRIWGYESTRPWTHRGSPCLAVEERGMYDLRHAITGEVLSHTFPVGYIARTLRVAEWPASTWPSWALDEDLRLPEGI